MKADPSHTSSGLPSAVTRRAALWQALTGALTVATVLPAAAQAAQQEPPRISDSQSAEFVPENNYPCFD
jgi:hypothetical protein